MNDFIRQPSHFFSNRPRKKNTIVLLVLLVLISDLRADDGVFFAGGNTLVPLEETTIELKKEILILNKNSEYSINVGIYFEFFNPGVEVEKLVGFVTPPADGPLDESEKVHPHIMNFMVEVNNQPLEYKIDRMENTGFQFVAESPGGVDFIYYFKVRFKKGLNIIRHSYSYDGGMVSDRIAPGPFYKYRLTTGKTWANKKIDSFELYLNLGNDKYFKVPSGFKDGSLADWKIVGTGKLGKIDPKSPEMINVKINSGFLYYRANDFIPDIDLSIDVLNPVYELHELGYLYNPEYFNDSTRFSVLSNADLRILRNSIYALHGYKFQSQDLLDYFSKYDWYIPDPNLDENDIRFTEEQKALLDIIVEEEKRRQI
jgi:hypothetical protein